MSKNINRKILRWFFIIIVIVLIILGGIYFTKIMVDKQSKPDSTPNKPAETVSFNIYNSDTQLIYLYKAKTISIEKSKLFESLPKILKDEYEIEINKIYIDGMDIVVDMNKSMISSLDKGSANAAYKLSVLYKSLLELENVKAVKVLVDGVAGVEGNHFSFLVPATLGEDGRTEVEKYFTKTPALSTSTAEQTLKQISDNAKKGISIGNGFAVKTSTLEDVEKVWGKADSMNYIAEAKGTYATYNIGNAAFGFNKGMQIFETRYYDKSLQEIKLNDITNYFGKAPYDNISKNDERILGYKVNSDYKLLFVFGNQSSTTNPSLIHYSVLYPSGTINSMADDKGREW